MPKSKNEFVRVEKTRIGQATFDIYVYDTPKGRMYKARGGKLCRSKAEVVDIIRKKHPGLRG